MSNRLPRALLADVAATLAAGDTAAALMMLGDEDGPEQSAAVSSYRAICADRLGDVAQAERHLRVALDLVERRSGSTPEDEVRFETACRLLPAPMTPITPTLEVISPRLTAVRLRLMLADIFSRAGMTLEAEMECALLPEGLRQRD